MLDSICSMFRCHRRFAQPRTRRSKAEETQIAADDAQIAVTEAHDMTAALELGEADELAGQGLADEHVLAPPLDGPRRAHTPHLVIGVIPRLLEPRRQLPRRRTPVLVPAASGPSASCGRSSL